MVDELRDCVMLKKWKLPEPFGFWVSGEVGNYFAKARLARPTV